MRVVPISLGRTVPTRSAASVEFFFPFKQYENLACIAQPRYGKGGIAKPLVVQVSKYRRVLIGDFKGEWQKHVTKPNYKSAYPDYIEDYQVYRGFTMHLRDFQHTSDWVSMGFGHGAEQLRNLFVDSMQIHKGIPSRFLEIIMDLPVKEADLAEFNQKYKNVLRGAFNWMHVQSYKNNAPHRLRWFWQGPEDKRPIYDFVQEWLAHNVIFLDFTKSEAVSMEATYLKQTFFGKILEQMEPYYERLQGVIVLEEADKLLPNPRNGPTPSSNLRMIDFSAKAPKTGMACVVLMQNREQTDPRIFKSGQWTYLMGLYEGYPKPFRGLPRLDGRYREFLYLDEYRNWVKLTPGTPCCEYESNARMEAIL